MDPLLASIIIFAGNFEPRGWAFCSGQILSIAQNTALFSLLGTTYGGDGRVTFALPDLRGRVPIGVGNGPGLTTRVLGEVGGAESVTLLTSNLPAHSHTVSVSVPVSANGGTSHTAATDGSLVLAPVVDGSGLDGQSFVADSAPTGKVNSLTGNSGITGANIPVANMMPYLAINYIIALQGVFPSRN